MKPYTVPSHSSFIEGESMYSDTTSPASGTPIGKAIAKISVFIFDASVLICTEISPPRPCHV